MSQAFCPNCHIGLPDTPVEYDEILYALYSSTASSPRRRARSFRGASTYGRVALCAACAAAYRRMVRLRATGHKAVNYGFAVLLIGAVVFALLVSSVPSWGTGVPAYLLATPVNFGLLAILAGAVLVAAAAIMKRPATRFLAHPTTQSSPSTSFTAAPPAAPAVPSTVAFTPDPASREAARAARARRRRRIRRLGWIGFGVAWIAAIIAVLAIFMSTLGQHSLASHPLASFDDPLTQSSAGWANTGGCTFHDSAYHIAPPGGRLGLTCLAPAGAYTDFDLSVTATLVAGAPDAAFGLAFRYADGNAYLFEISGDGHAHLSLLSTGSAAPISPVWTFVTRTRPTASHTLRVVAKSASFTLFVDRTQIATFSDSHYISGEVGLFVSHPGMDVAFTNFSVSATS